MAKLLLTMVITSLKSMMGSLMLHFAPVLMMRSPVLTVSRSAGVALVLHQTHVTGPQHRLYTKIYDWTMARLYTKACDWAIALALYQNM